jgi:hypothetical protein
MSLDMAAVSVAGCFDSGMAYVALSRVRKLRALHFRRPCEVQGCEGCEKCRCALSLKDIKVSAHAKGYYALVAEAQRLAAELEPHSEAARGLLFDGMRTLADRAAALATECTTPRGQQLTKELVECTGALNPGAMDAPRPLRVHDPNGPPTVVGWWTQEVRVKKVNAQHE